MPPQQILDYLAAQRIGVIALEMPDGSPHAATVHFAHTDDPFVFYFETKRDSRKTELLLKKDTIKASFVVGTEEGKMKTLQLDGAAQLVKPEEQALVDSIYSGKFPGGPAVKDPRSLNVKFTPTWWRFTDWATPQGKLILTSE